MNRCNTINQNKKGNKIKPQNEFHTILLLNNSREVLKIQFGYDFLSCVVF